MFESFWFLLDTISFCNLAVLARFFVNWAPGPVGNMRARDVEENLLHILNLLTAFSFLTFTRAVTRTWEVKALKIISLIIFWFSFLTILIFSLAVSRTWEVAALSSESVTELLTALTSQVRVIMIMIMLVVMIMIRMVMIMKLRRWATRRWRRWQSAQSALKQTR